MDPGEPHQNRTRSQDIQDQMEEEEELSTINTAAQEVHVRPDLPIDMHGKSSMRFNPQSEIQPVQLHGEPRYQQVHRSYTAMEQGQGRGPMHTETPLIHPINNSYSNAFIPAQLSTSSGAGPSSAVPTTGDIEGSFASSPTARVENVNMAVNENQTPVQHD